MGNKILALLAHKIANQITAVKDLDQTFTCSFMVILKWHDETFRPVAEKKIPKSKVDWKRHWYPKFDLTNALEIQRTNRLSTRFYVGESRRNQEGSEEGRQEEVAEEKTSNKKTKMVTKVVSRTQFTGVFYEQLRATQLPI
mmetsp:Transcript_31063/g.71810  ORF Transcript_31063/g.71810 Transcript_31063/m.71810 type:complete len:141 (-) Transcript_31063:841-1263(-)